MQADTEQEKRWKTCAKYIRMTGSLPDAQKRAKQDGVSFNTSVWIAAFGKILEGKV
jgi:hypothetical protein